MKNLLFSVLILFSFATQAAPRSKYLTDQYMKIINLVGVQVLDQNKQNTFGYKVRPIVNPHPELVLLLQDNSNSQIVSPIYELNQASNFKNVYVYIGKNSNGQYEFVMAYHNKSNSIFIVDMDIVNAEQNALYIMQGMRPRSDKYLVTVQPGTLFPL